MKTMTMIVCAMGLAATANAQSFELGNGALDDGQQIEQGGPGSAPFFANAQGNDDQFQEYYVMRFDLSAYSGATVTGVELDMRHEEAFFSAAGPVSLSYSTDDAFDLSTLAADSGDVGGNTQLAATQVATFNFTVISGSDDTTIDTFVLSDLDGLFADVQAGGVITLVLEAADPATAATYSGMGNFDGAPVLRVIPTPGAAALFGLAGLTAARRRR